MWEGGGSDVKHEIITRGTECTRMVLKRALLKGELNQLKQNNKGKRGIKKKLFSGETEKDKRLGVPPSIQRFVILPSPSFILSPSPPSKPT